MHELQALETITDKLKDILTPEQTARYLIQVEKFKHKSTTSIFNLWGLRKYNYKGNTANDGTLSERADSQSRSSQHARNQRMTENDCEMADCCDGQGSCYNNQDIEDVSAFPDDSLSPNERDEYCSES